MVFNPHRPDPLPVPAVEGPLALHHVVHEGALEQLAVWEF
jgi:hypothetical protein